MTVPSASGAPLRPSIRRFTSRLERLDHAFLRERLRSARSYDRIAGYFRSSIFEVAAEELASVGRIRIVCNSDLNPQDINASKEARTRALMQRWREGSGDGGVAIDALLHRNRYVALRDLLQARNADGHPKVEVKVVDRFTAPLVHGKAGIITLADGTKTCFMGSVNETREAWQDHYELIWEDPSAEAIQWTQEEFDFLWAKSLPLPDAVILEIARCAERVEIRMPDCPPWDEKGDTDLPRAALAEAPLMRAGDGGALMLGPPPGTRVFLACGTTDMRRGFDGLAAQVHPDHGSACRLDPPARTHPGLCRIDRRQRDCWACRSPGE